MFISILASVPLVLGFPGQAEASPRSGPETLVPRGLAQEPEPAPEEEQNEVREAAASGPLITTAEASAVESMLSALERSVEEGVSADVIEVLRRMGVHDNEEFCKPVVRLLRYEASKLDREAVAARADELGISQRSKIKAMVRALEAEVQAVAARVLANIPGSASTSALTKALKDKDVLKERPLAAASIIDALGRLDHEKVAKLVESELKAQRHPLIARASVRYFGQIQTKDMDIVRILISRLDPPSPIDVDDPSNPPASYWEARWRTWSETRREVTWALKEITGETWRPAEGDQPSDSARALRFVKENARKLGLK